MGVTGSGDVVEVEAEAAEEGDALLTEGDVLALLLCLLGGSHQGDGSAVDVVLVVGQRVIVLRGKHVLPRVTPRDAHPPQRSCSAHYYCLLTSLLLFRDKTMSGDPLVGAGPGHRVDLSSERFAGIKTNLLLAER